MLRTDIPAKLTIAWANAASSAFVRPIPTASQIGIVDGAASYTDGFVPLNAQPIASGGIPPDVKDMNGVLKAVTAWVRWLAAGATPSYDGAFAAAVNGYPSGALLASTTQGIYWYSTVDNNMTDPDGSSPSGWTAFGTPPFASVATTLAGTVTTQATTPAGVAQASQSGAYNYAAATGTANAITAALTPAPAALPAGFMLRLAIGSTNGAGGVTINMNGFGAKPVRFAGQPVLAGTLVAGQIYEVVYDGANWQLQNPLTPSAVLGLNGYAFRADGVIEVWGRDTTFRSGEAQFTISLPSGFLGFPNAIDNVQATAINTSNSNNRDTTIQHVPTSSLTTLSFYTQNNGGAGGNTDGFNYRVIGH